MPFLHKVRYQSQRVADQPMRLLMLQLRILNRLDRKPYHLLNAVLHHLLAQQSSYSDLLESVQCRQVSHLEHYRACYEPQLMRQNLLGNCLLKLALCIVDFGACEQVFQVREQLRYLQE